MYSDLYTSNNGKADYFIVTESHGDGNYIEYIVTDKHNAYLLAIE